MPSGLDYVGPAAAAIVFVAVIGVRLKGFDATIAVVSRRCAVRCDDKPVQMGGFVMPCGNAALPGRLSDAVCRLRNEVGNRLRLGDVDGMTALRLGDR